MASQLVIEDQEVLIGNESRKDPAGELFRADRIYLQTGYSLLGNTTAVYRTLDFSALRFTASIQAAAESICQNFNAHTIGVHIRRTDHPDAIANSPLEVFLQEMDQRLTDVPDTLFYLASDDSSVKQQLLQRYGNRIITFDCQLSRDSSQGMRDAAIELLCLSKTTQIWGSYWSSYSEMAAVLGDIDLKVIQSSATS